MKKTLVAVDEVIAVLNASPAAKRLTHFEITKLSTQFRKLAAASPQPAPVHELDHFQPCTFGNGGFYYHDGADRAVCTCGWKSAAVQRDKPALIKLWQDHRDTAVREAA